MLSWMRTFVKSPIAVLVLGLVGAAMVITLPDAFRGASMGGGFVTIDSREVTARDVTRETDNQLERIRAEQNQVVSAKEAAQRGLTQQVLDSLIYRNTVL